MMFDLELLRRSVSTVKHADTRSMYQDILNNFIIVRRRLSIFRMYFAYALHLMLIEFVQFLSGHVGVTGDYIFTISGHVGVTGDYILTISGHVGVTGDYILTISEHVGVTGDYILTISGHVGVTGDYILALV